MSADYKNSAADFEGRDADPLLGFLVEPPSETPHLPASKRDVSTEPVAAPASGQSELAERLDRAERAFERALIDVKNLKCDLATLVNAVDDIKKQQSRRIDPVPPPPAKPAMRPRAVVAAAAAVLLVFVVTWGVISLASYDMPQPPPIETASVDPVREPAPTAPLVTALPEIQRAAVVSAVLPARDVPARVEAQVRDESRSAAYIGTLTVDASPAGEVFVNRKSVGRTPVRLERLRAGSHLVWIEREGYRRWTRVVAVAADRVSRVSADLDPLPVR
jgi:hypothetical protein